MPAKRELTMRQIRQMLRLAPDAGSAREIGRTLGVARSTIQDNLKRASAAGLAWPLVGDLTDAVLEQRLFAHAGVKRGFRRRVEPDWGSLACELKRPGVNLMVLWEEYRAVHPGGYGYSRFCDLFREFERRLSPTMRQDHPAGDKVFVDYSGKKIMIVDRSTGGVFCPDLYPRAASPAALLLAGRGERGNRRRAGAHQRAHYARLSVCRRHLFETVEMPVLAPLPDADFQFAEWRVARVSLDYHVEIDGFFYSVPHSLIREQVDVRATIRTIELFHRGVRVAAHQRRYGGRRHGTDPDHIPSAHRRYAEWTPDRFRRWGRSIGPNTEGLVLAILANRPHPEQGFRTCLGVLRLFKDIDPERAELIAARAVAVSALTYKSIASIIANKLERRSRDTEDAVIEHPNLRGPGYFH